MHRRDSGPSDDCAAQRRLGADAALRVAAVKLIDPWFEATFIGGIREDGGAFRRIDSIEGAQAVFLYSPCGYGLTDGTHGVIVPFANPRNASAVPAAFKPTPRWEMSGASLDDLTLTPSIDCTVENPEHAEANRAAGLQPGECRPGRRCWHGFITNGEVT